MLGLGEVTHTQQRNSSKPTLAQAFAQNLDLASVPVPDCRLLWVACFHLQNAPVEPSMLISCSTTSQAGFAGWQPTPGVITPWHAVSTGIRRLYAGRKGGEINQGND